VEAGRIYTGIGEKPFSAFGDRPLAAG